MVTTEEYLLQALLEAEQMERDGRQFYLQAAAKVKSATVRQALEYLAEAEKYHIDKFNQIYQSLKNDPRWTESMAAFQPLPCDPNAYKRALKMQEEEPADYDYDLQALQSGLVMERQAIECYTRLANEATNPLARRFFKSIANEEQEHYNTILNLKKCLESNLEECPISGVFD